MPIVCGARKCKEGKEGLSGDLHEPCGEVFKWSVLRVLFWRKVDSVPANQGSRVGRGLYQIETDLGERTLHYGPLCTRN